MDNIKNIKSNTIRDFSSANTLSDKFFIFDSDSKDVGGFNRLKVTDYPVRLDITTAILCEGGSLNIKLGYNNYTIRENDFILILDSRVFQITGISENFKAKIICLKPGYFEFGNDQYSFEAQNLLREYPCQPLSPKKMGLFLSFLDYMKDVLQDNSNIYRKQIVYNILITLFYEVSNLLLLEKENNKNKKSNPNEMIFRKFLKDIETHYQKERTIIFYADKACLTPKYFSLLIFKQTGKHAKEWIDEYTILEAKAMLKSTYMTIQQISYEMNFATPSHFCRYFRHHTGISPRQYRND